MAMAIVDRGPAPSHRDRAWQQFCRNLDMAAAKREAAPQPRVHNTGCAYVKRYGTSERMCQYQTCARCSDNPGNTLEA